MKKVHDTRVEVNYQMDVRYLMSKIRFLENVAEILISEEQSLCLLLTDLPTIDKDQKDQKSSLILHDVQVTQ